MTTKAGNTPVNVRFSYPFIDGITLLVEAGLFLSPSELIRDGVRDLLMRFRVLKYNDLDYPIAYKTQEEIELQDQLHEVVKKLREARERREQLFTSEV